MLTLLLFTIVNCQIKIYIESLCPDTKKEMVAISNTTIQNIDKIGQIQFIAAGKISDLIDHKNNTYFNECQHDENECYGNMIIACGLKLMKNQTESVQFIKCFFQNLNQSKNDRESIFKNSIDKCINTIQNKLLLNACTHSPQGIELLYQNIKLTPKLNYVPSIQIDDNNVEKLIQDFGRQICKKDEYIEQCKDFKWL